VVVAAAQIVLDFWGNDEPRDKKKLIEALSQALNKEHNLTLYEVDAFNDVEKCVLGLSFCSSDREKARVKMQKIIEFLDKQSAARMVREDVDFIDFS
jgi:uncharacterized protein YlxP (DUF503 family)